MPRTRSDRPLTRQRPIPGGRTRSYLGLDPRIYRALVRIAAKAHCTIPRVESTLLADQLGIDLNQLDRYDFRPEHVAPTPREPQS
jgi:hypothetical protein